MKKYLIILWCGALFHQASRASLGCLASYAPLGALDYKEWRIVQNCTCDCERSHTILRGGLCSGCGHRHSTIPLNAERNIIDMQAVVKAVHINRLVRYRRRGASKKG